MRQCVVKRFQPIVRFTSEQFEATKKLFEHEGEALETLGDAHLLIPARYVFFKLTSRLRQDCNRPEYIQMS